jgi:hypothetical protein
MRCCASPTTSTAADARAAERRELAELSARDVMSAVLFREILKPLANGLGPVGEIAIGAVADQLFVRKPR